MNALNSSFEPRNPEYAARVRDSFNAQTVMQTITASLTEIGPGRVVIELPYRKDLTQQHGFIHAGISSTIMDSACGYAAFSLMPETAEVLTVEFKTNLLAPASGDLFRAVGEVRKSGKQIFVAESSLYAIKGSDEKLVATMNGTLMAVYPERVG